MDGSGHIFEGALDISLEFTKLLLEAEWHFVPGAAVTIRIALSLFDGLGDDFTKLLVVPFAITSFVIAALELDFTIDAFAAFLLAVGPTTIEVLHVF